jgi:MoaA/NifB/PqqE/SkfB family radical SAM enzyme
MPSRTSLSSSSHDGSHLSPSGDITARFRLYVPRAGHPDWPALHAEARELAAAIRPILEPPPSRLRDYVRRARSWLLVARNHAANLRRARAGREDLWPLYLIWTTQRACNFRCWYCDDHRGRRYPDLSNAGVLDTKRAIRMLEVMRTRTPSVLLAGGEPTLRRDLPEITRAARNLDYYPIIVDTNGSTLHDLLRRPAWRTWLADVDHLVVSLDALDPMVLQRMWQTDRPVDVIRNLLLMRELCGEMRVHLMVSAVVQPGAVGHACDVLDWCNDLGICFCPMPLNVGPTIEPSLLHDAEYRAFVARVLKRKRAGYRIAGSLRMNERMLTAAPLDCRNTLKPHIDYDGQLFWPCKGAVSERPVEIDVLEFPNVEAIYRHGAAQIDPKGFRFRCGARCNWSQNYTTDAYAHGLAHPWSIVREIVDFLKAV